jgi:hypothetical protein
LAFSSFGIFRCVRSINDLPLVISSACAVAQCSAFIISDHAAIYVSGLAIDAIFEYWHPSRIQMRVLAEQTAC